MTEIIYNYGKENGAIHWAVAEQFEELTARTFYLNEMEAAQIEKLEDLSITAKILLSAVAGAVIQHLIDKGIEADQIFREGSFTVRK